MASHQALIPRSSPSGREEYNGQGYVAVAVLFIVLEVICVALRFWARKIGKIAWGLDDGLIIAAAILCLALIGCCLGEQCLEVLLEAPEGGTTSAHALQTDNHYRGGVGYHRADLAATAPHKIITSAKYTLVIPLFYLPAVILAKLALLVMYTRIFIKRTDLVACWVVAALLIANCVGAMIAGFLICVPLRYLWDHTIPGGHCININAWYRWSSLMNIFTDVIMLILPLPVIWKIQTSRKVKIGLTITFATGSVGLITSLIRFSGFFSEDAVTDVTWNASKLIILTIVESGVYLIAACLPTFRPLAIFLWTKQPVSSSGNSGSGASAIKLGLPKAQGRHAQTHETQLTSLPNCNTFTPLDRETEWPDSSRQSSRENSRGDTNFFSQTKYFNGATPRDFNA